MSENFTNLTDMVSPIAQTAEINTMELDDVPEGTRIDNWIIPENSILEYYSPVLTGYMKRCKKIRNYKNWLEKCITRFATKEEYEAELSRRDNERKKAEEDERKKKEEDEKNRHFSVIKELKEYSDIDRKYTKFNFESIDSDFLNANFELLDFLKLYVTTPFRKLRELGRGLYLYGNVGTGKTTMLCCIANAFIELEKEVVFSSCVSLIDKIQNNNKYKYKILNTPVLFLDDLSKTTVSDYYISTLFEIIDYRSANGYLTHFSNNLCLLDTIKEWKAKGKAKDETLHSLHSRLNGCVIEKEIMGNDRRKKMSFQGFESILKQIAKETNI